MCWTTEFPKSEPKEELKDTDECVREETLGGESSLDEEESSLEEEEDLLLFALSAAGNLLKFPFTIQELFRILL